MYIYIYIYLLFDIQINTKSMTVRDRLPERLVKVQQCCPPATHKFHNVLSSHLRGWHKLTWIPIHFAQFVEFWTELWAMGVLPPPSPGSWTLPPALASGSGELSVLPHWDLRQSPSRKRIFVSCRCIFLTFCGYMVYQLSHSQTIQPIQANDSPLHRKPDIFFRGNTI